MLYLILISLYIWSAITVGFLVFIDESSTGLGNAAKVATFLGLFWPIILPLLIGFTILEIIRG